MKKRIVLTGLLMLTGSLCAKVVNMAEVDSQTALGDLSDLVIEFRQGQQVPVSFLSIGELFTFASDQTTIGEVQQTFYARVAEGEIQLSLDNCHWKPITEFATGSIEVSLGENGITCKLEANVRS